MINHFAGKRDQIKKEIDSTEFIMKSKNKEGQAAAAGGQNASTLGNKPGAKKQEPAAPPAPLNPIEEAKLQQEREQLEAQK